MHIDHMTYVQTGTLRHICILITITTIKLSLTLLQICRSPSKNIFSYEPSENSSSWHLLLGVKSSLHETCVHPAAIFSQFVFLLQRTKLRDQHFEGEDHQSIESRALSKAAKAA